jgi:enoyl-CoA hydratase/carnithine racemase
MATMQLDVKEGVQILTLLDGDTENRLNQDVVEEYLANLDKAVSYEGNTALIINCEHEKTMSTGIDLEWLGQQNETNVLKFVKTLEQVMIRLARLNMPTIAAINGNCYAGGAILMSATDYRFMRADRGRFCYPEVNIGIPFTPVMQDIVGLMPNKKTLKDMCLLGKPLTGEECLQGEVVDGIFPMAELQAQTFEFAKMLSQKDRKTYTRIKRQMRPDIEKHNEQLFS